MLEAFAKLIVFSSNHQSISFLPPPSSLLPRAAPSQGVASSLSIGTEFSAKRERERTSSPEGRERPFQSCLICGLKERVETKGGA